MTQSRRLIRPALMVLAVLATVSAAPAVEGGGAFRGNGVLVPYFRNSGNEITFIRLLRAYSFAEPTGGASAIEQVHVTYQTPDGSGRCGEQNGFLDMTRQDYYLLNVRSDPTAFAPAGEGYVVAWLESTENHLSADAVTVDLSGGTAWGVAAVSFRVADPMPDPGVETVVGGRLRTDSGPRSGEAGPSGGLLDGIGCEATRFPESFYPTVMAPAANIQGARTSNDGTRYVIVPLSWDIERARTALIPETLSPGEAYSNRYSFDVRLFDSDENRLSMPSRTVRCWDVRSAEELLGGSGTSFLAGTSGVERYQGWLHLDGRGRQQLSLNEAPGSLDYFNRAVVVQVEELRLGGDRVRWAVYPAHDRTTAEIDPDPAVANASGSGGAIATDPDFAPIFF